MHIDDFISDENQDSYAKKVFNLFRLPAYEQVLAHKEIRAHKLFCTYEGKRYRVTGASRLGDVWLAENFDRTTGYDYRVDVAKCSEWGKDE